MMFRKKAMLSLFGVALLIGSVRAEKVDFRGDVNVNWTNANNWFNESGSVISVPGVEDDVRIGQGTVTITTESAIGSLKVGVGGAARVIIDGGSLVATSSTNHNSASDKFGGSIYVKNGGSATFNGRVLVGISNSVGYGSLVIDQGTVRVAGKYIHNAGYLETDVINTRTTVNTGGLLDVDRLMLDAGVMDIAGGIVIVRQGDIEQLRAWVEEGRIIAMNGMDGYNVKVIFDKATGYVKITAELPVVLGMWRPIVRKAFQSIG